MNNTDKLLRAFIEASGFDVEEVETTKDFYSPQWINTDGSLMDGAVPMGTVKDIDYKVTKKQEDITTHTGTEPQKGEPWGMYADGYLSYLANEDDNENNT